MPWVPATPSVRRLATTEPRTSPRRATVPEPARAAASSTFISRTAGEKVTRSTSRTVSGSWPMVMATPARRRCSVIGVTCTSLPETVWPRSWSNNASALIPEPPTPMTWMRVGKARGNSVDIAKHHRRNHRSRLGSVQCRTRTCHFQKARGCEFIKKSTK